MCDASIETLFNDHEKKEVPIEENKAHQEKKDVLIKENEVHQEKKDGPIENALSEVKASKQKESTNKCELDIEDTKAAEEEEEEEDEDEAVEQEQEVKGVFSDAVDRYVVRLRGLPWSARENEIRSFFSDEQVVEVQIVYLTDGRASGEALVEFNNLSSFQSSFLKNRHHIGHRYIEIFKSTAIEIDTAAGRASRPKPRPPKSQYVIRMRGLPYSATDEDVKEFFSLPKPTGIHLIKDDLGRPSGEGFVEFANEVDAIAAMAKHRHNMGHRYIELFRSSPEELMRALGLTSGWYNSRNGGPQPKSACILMRGLPYSCTESDITKFFQEIDVTPIRIHRKADGAEAYVEFYSISDTDKAMTRHRNYIGRRYIELFRVTYEDMARTVGLPVANTNIPASALSINPNTMMAAITTSNSTIKINKDVNIPNKQNIITTQHYNSYNNNTNNNNNNNAYFTPHNPYNANTSQYQHQHPQHQQQQSHHGYPSSYTHTQHHVHSNTQQQHPSYTPNSHLLLSLSYPHATTQHNQQHHQHYYHTQQQHQQQYQQQYQQQQPYQPQYYQ